MQDDNAIAKAVEDSLAADPSFKPTPLLRPLPRAENTQPARRPTGTTMPENSHETWLALGEKLHDQQSQRVAELTKKYDDEHSALVAQARALEVLKAELEEEQRRLAMFRRRLGYGV